MTIRADLVTVYHNDTNYKQHIQLRDAIAQHEPTGGYRFIAVDNRTRNRGFAAGCNTGALHPDADAPIIGFLNPDTIIEGPFLAAVERAITGPVVITGCRFNKPTRELDMWGVDDWVCGAAFFVKRTWFQNVKGFDEQFVWSHEETDLIRQAQAHRLQAKSISLPISHESPPCDSQTDDAYKKFHFEQSHRRFARKWAKRRI